MTLANRYQLMLTNMNWTNAHLHCNANRMNLVVLLNQDENLSLQSYLESNAGQLSCSYYYACMHVKKVSNT